MKKVLSYILISLIISANFLAPISVGFNGGKNIEVKKNVTEAADSIKVTTSPQKTNTTISGTVRVVFESGDFGISNAAAIVYLLDTNNVALFVQNIELKDAVIDNTNTMEKEAYAVRTGNFNFPNLNPSTTYVLKTVASQTTPLWASTVVSAAGAVAGGVVAGVFTLNPLGMAAGMVIGAKLADPGTESNETSIGESPAITTNDTNNQDVVILDKNVNVNQNYIDSILPVCSAMFWTTIGGCIGGILYWGVFKPTSVLFALSGMLFDKTFAYSIQDSSYRSAFVVQGWGLVRDFCNMFFIFIMLYVAIGTILSLHSMKTKETIVNIVIIGIFINFSLFATQLIIDASNITARVFYNSDAIKVGPKIDGVIQNAPGSTGEIKLSEALISKINPQNLIINASEVGNISAKGTLGTNGNQAGGVSASTFILVILLTSAINIVGFTVFLTVGFLFITRVIGLWLAMIIAPLAFFTYILPSMAKTKMVGWEHWWEDTLKLAFLAPVFIFFLYIIIKFLDTGLGIFSTDGKSGIDFILGITIPFIFIMIFLIKAKKLAVDMSGEFGEMAVKAGSAVGGMVLGGAVGAGAFAMRGTLGAMGNALAESKFAKTNGRFGRMLGDAGKWTGSKTFDARNSALGAMAGKEMGVDMGKAKEGGYAKHKADVQKRGEERAKSLEVGHDEHEMHDLHDKQEALQRLRDKNAPEIDALEGKIASTQMDATDKSRQAINAEAIANQPGATAAQIATARALRQDAKRLDEEVMELKNQKNAINRATEYRDKDGNLVKDYSDRKEMVNVSSSMVQKTEEDAQNKEAVAQAATNNITTVTTAANAQATAEINQAQITATASITQAQTNAAAAIARAQADTLAANQAKTAAFNNSMMNPQDQNAKNAYDQAVIAYNNAQANVATATTTANNSVIQAQTEATTKVTEATTKANNTMNQTITDTTQSAAAKTTAAATARTTADTLKTAHNSGQKVARSKNELDFEDVPDAKFTISKENSARKNEYANEIQSRWFNKKANAHAAHDIRMNAEIKADVNGH